SAPSSGRSAPGRAKTRAARAGCRNHHGGAKRAVGMDNSSSLLVADRTCGRIMAAEVPIPPLLGSVGHPVGTTLRPDPGAEPMSNTTNTAERGRFSSQRKTAAVLRLLRGEDLELVSRELAVTGATVSGWRDDFLAGGQAALKSRPADDRDDEIAR